MAVRQPKQQEGRDMDDHTAVHAVDPSLFTHLRMVLSMVVSLGMARLLSGAARIVQHPGRTRLYWVHLLWGLSMLLTLMHFWGWQFSLARVAVWRFEVYFFIVAYAALYYLLCSLLFPDDVSDYAGWRDYFYSRRRWFFGLLAVSFAADVLDSAIKGRAYLEAQGTEYLVRIAVYVVLCAAAAFVRSERFHAAFAVGNLVYQVSWILRIYDVLE
jgi:hypothetical protein